MRRVRSVRGIGGRHRKGVCGGGGATSAEDPSGASSAASASTSAPARARRAVRGRGGPCKATGVLQSLWCGVECVQVLVRGRAVVRHEYGARDAACPISTG